MVVRPVVHHVDVDPWAVTSTRNVGSISDGNHDPRWCWLAGLACSIASTCPLVLAPRGDLVVFHAVYDTSELAQADRRAPLRYVTIMGLKRRPRRAAPSPAPANILSLAITRAWWQLTLALATRLLDFVDAEPRARVHGGRLHAHRVLLLAFAPHFRYAAEGGDALREKGFSAYSLTVESGRGRTLASGEIGESAGFTFGTTGCRHMVCGSCFVAAAIAEFTSWPRSMSVRGRNWMVSWWCPGRKSEVI